MECKTCGGELLRLDSGKYTCLYCGNSFQQKKGTADFEKIALSNRSSGDDCGTFVYEKNIGSVLEITWEDGDSLISGSGFLISDSGYAITNAHVVTDESGESCGRVTVKISGASVSAKVLTLGDDQHGSGNGIDLALIKLDRVPAGAHKVSFESFDQVKTGEKVFVIGNSLGEGNCITSGIVSDRLRNVEGANLLMTDCAVNGGNSGGPIFNGNGRVVGVIVAGIVSAKGMNYAIPSDAVVDFINGDSQLKSTEFANRGTNGYELLDGEFKLPPSPPPPITKAICPCPKCGGTNGEIQNGIFHCLDCDFEG